MRMRLAHMLTSMLIACGAAQSLRAEPIAPKSAVRIAQPTSDFRSSAARPIKRSAKDSAKAVARDTRSAEAGASRMKPIARSSADPAAAADDAGCRTFGSAARASGRVRSTTDAPAAASNQARADAPPLDPDAPSCDPALDAFAHSPDASTTVAGSQAKGRQAHRPARNDRNTSNRSQQSSATKDGSQASKGQAPAHARSAQKVIVVAPAPAKKAQAKPATPAKPQPASKPAAKAAGQAANVKRN